MKINWNEVTPFSRACAIIILFFVVPVLAFYFGVKYKQVSLQETKIEQAQNVALENEQPTTRVFVKNDATANIVIDRFTNKIQFYGEAFESTENQSSPSYLIGEAPLIGNTAVFINTELAQGDTSCKTTFVYINRNTLSLNVENPQLCGWEEGVNFAGAYTLKTE